MRHIRYTLLLIGCVAATAAAPDPRDPLVGTWTGKSICTPLRPACHDEQALYLKLPPKGEVARNIDLRKE